MASPAVGAGASRGSGSRSLMLIPKPPSSSFDTKCSPCFAAPVSLDEERIALLLSWRHTGFSVHNAVTVEPDDAGATERLVRYLMRAPVSQQRLEIDRDVAEVKLHPRPRSDDAASGEEVETVDPDEAVARILAQIPEPRKHLIHSYGHYANAARAKRARDVAANPDAVAPASPALAATEPDSPERKAARKRSREPDSSPLRGRPSGLPSLRCDHENHRLHHRAASHSRHSRLAARRHAIHGQLAPPPTPRSPGRGWRALRGGQRAATLSPSSAGRRVHRLGARNLEISADQA